MIIVHSMLIVFIVFFLCSMAQSTWKTGIAPMPSSHHARKVMSQLLPIEPSICVDLGSGWGGMLVFLSKKYPEAQIIGYECSWIPYLYAKIFCRRRNISLYRKDFLTVFHPKEAVFFCYLCPEGMREISTKLRTDAEWLISHSFVLPSYTPVLVCPINDVFRSTIYLYSLKDSSRTKKDTLHTASSFPEPK